MTKSFTFLLVVILFLFNIHLTSDLFAANGTIKGKITDAQTKDILPFSTVLLKGTGFGASADKDGGYVIHNIPSGNYILRATYIGFKAQEIEVQIKDGGTLKLDIALNPESIQGETVVVTAQAEGQMQAINEQLTSIPIKNVVSAAKIQELPDANAAESVGRLPGVSILREGGEGSKVVVRGLSPQYNQVTIDGVQLPGNVVSNDPNEQSSIVGDRATNLSMISSSMLGGIEVIKAITPDMDATVIGGVVNFGLRKAVKNKFNKPSFELLSQGSYNDLKNTYGDYLLVGSYEQRFFNQSLGVFVQGTTEKRNRSSNNLGVSYQLKDKTHGEAGVPDIGSVDLSDVNSIKKRQGATLILDYAHQTGEIGFMNFFSTSKTNSTYRNQSFAYEGNDIFYSATDSENKLNVITNLFSVKQDIPLFHIDLKLSHTYSESKNPQDITFLFWQDGAGFANKGDLSKLHPKALVAIAKPDRSTARLETIRTSGNFSKDRALTAAADFQTEFFNSGFLTTKLKFGGMYQYRDRSYDLDHGLGPNIHLGGGNTVSKILERYPDMETYQSSVTISDFIDQSYSFGDFLNGDYPISYPINVGFMKEVLNLVRVGASPESFQINRHGSVIYDYNGTEKKSAAYTMITFNLGEQITFLPGIRYQNLTTSYFAHRGEQVPGGYQYRDTTVSIPHGFWLPMVHLRYKPLSWLQIHFAYTNTLNYPDYNAIIPKYDVGPSTISYNNYRLKPALSENYDLVFSIYNNEIGLLTFNGFKKNIKDLIFASKTYLTDLSPYPDLPQGRKQLYEFNTFINNSIMIDLWGIETDWQTNFWYLPKPFSGIVFNINYTHIFSEASYPRSEVQIKYNDDGTFTRTIMDTFYTTRLLNQPNDILNLSLGFDYMGFSGRLSMLYQDNIFKKPAFWMQERINSDKHMRWDISVKQELPWYGIQLFLNLNNLFSENDTDLNQKNSFPATEQRYGMTGDVGVRLRF